MLQHWKAGLFLEDVVREIMEDPIFKGNQNFKFELDLDEAGKRLFGGDANAGVAFQIGQLRYVILIYMYVHYLYLSYICPYMFMTCIYMDVICISHVCTCYIHKLYMCLN